MGAVPDPAALYPEVAAAGGLAAALEAVSAQNGIAVSFQSSESRPLNMATVASSAPRRTLLTVSAWTWERRWSIRGCESFQGLALIEGESQDLVQIARAAQAWHAGTALVEIQHTAPFVHLTGRFEVPTDDPMQTCALCLFERAHNWQTLENGPSAAGS